MFAGIHWHARDEEQKHKETIERSLAVAEAAGLDAIVAMPNTTRPLISLERCQEYLTIADKVDSKVKFFVNIGLTSDKEQIKRAVQAYHREPRIVGMKLFMGKSTGTLSVVEYEEQAIVFETLRKEGYEGVVACHCEKESLMDVTKYNQNNPRSWSEICRPEDAEIASFDDAVNIGEETNFAGTIQVCHVSTLEVVDKINNYQGHLKISFEITPQHLFLDWTILSKNIGRWYKCNPPLRCPEIQQGLLQRMLDGKIPIIASDHAPHTVYDKMKNPPASGIASGTAWPYVMRELQELGMSDELLHKVGYQNAVDLYGLENLGVECRKREVDWTTLKALQATYPHNAFHGIFRGCD